MHKEVKGLSRNALDEFFGGMNITKVHYLLQQHQQMSSLIGTIGLMPIKGYGLILT